MSLLTEGRLDTITIGEVAHKVMYRHLRPTDAKGNPHEKGGATSASIFVDNKHITMLHHFSGDEVYRRRLGRIIATGKLLKLLGQPRK